MHPSPLNTLVSCLRSFSPLLLPLLLPFLLPTLQPPFIFSAVTSHLPPAYPHLPAIPVTPTADHILSQISALPKHFAFVLESSICLRPHLIPDNSITSADSNSVCTADPNLDPDSDDSALICTVDLDSDPDFW